MISERETLAVFAGRRERVAGLTETLEASVHVHTLTVGTQVVGTRTLVLVCSNTTTTGSRDTNSCVTQTMKSILKSKSICILK